MTGELVKLAAGQWVLFRERYARTPFSYSMRQIEKVTPKLVKFAGASWPRQKERDAIVAVFDTREQAERFRDGCEGIGGEYNRREKAAREEYSRRKQAAHEAAVKQIAALRARAQSTATPEEGEKL